MDFLVGLCNIKHAHTFTVSVRTCTQLKEAWDSDDVFPQPQTWIKIKPSYQDYMWALCFPWINTCLFTSVTVDLVLMALQFDHSVLGLLQALFVFYHTHTRTHTHTHTHTHVHSSSHLVCGLSCSSHDVQLSLTCLSETGNRGTLGDSVLST